MISKSQFELFVKETGYVTSAEEGTDDASVIADNAATEATPFDQATLLFDKKGGWIQEDKSPEWKPGLSWRTSEQKSSNTADTVEPATVLSIRDATAFCEWLSAKENRQYRLPTTQEWTVAAELGRFHRRGNTDEATTKGTPPAPKTETSAPRLGEWTADSEHIRNQQFNIVAQRSVRKGERSLQQSLAPDPFRSSEIGFRVVTELRGGATDEPTKQETENEREEHGPPEVLGNFNKP